ncbi:hypothetical protein HPP92_011035 [Vanilla planifolia]|uniref:Homeobox domain-containing protein n=1 Tax=Vanilla planifolia TaxID=51239 RepID=A0A835R6C0_VANPL|nr:hypothetical protein HPP92_011035 [Vanilla planifolia]
MTTFYSSSTNQEEIIPNLYPRDTAWLHPELSFPGNMMYFHHPSSAPFPMNAQAPSAEATNTVSNRFGESTSDIWREGRNEMLLVETVGGSTNDDLNLGIINGQNFAFQQTTGSAMQVQGLSLSLGTQGSVPTFHYLPATADISFSLPHQPTSGIDGSIKDSPSTKQVHMNQSCHSLPYILSSTLSLKYLKAAQELLDEIVNIRKALNQKVDKNKNLGNSSGITDCKDVDEQAKLNEVPSKPDDTANSTQELSTSEKQELQNKVTKLMEMLDEVDRRYKQYHCQMELVMSSFDVIAGAGAAKPYTALALQTISRHFRCLRDSINDQIQSCRKKLGEQENGDSVRLCRLRYIDQQLRQQRVMQQYGMMQPHAWRPQRGLPENSVLTLRAWLFEHFLHPYPKDSEKLMLSRQTGLTRSQVSNWFINARVRLWKPMIEEMYKEELGETEMESKSSFGKPQKFRDTSYVVDKEGSQSSDAENHKKNNPEEPTKPNPTTGLDASGSDEHLEVKPSEQRLEADECSLIQTSMNHPDDASGRIMAYQMPEFAQYGSGVVSLTLGLQHWDSTLPVSSVREADVYGSNPSPLEENVGSYEYPNMGDRLQRFEPLHFTQDFAS